MSGYVDSSKSTLGYFVTFAGGAVAWQQGCNKVLHYLPLRQSSLLQLKLVKSCSG